MKTKIKNKLPEWYKDLRNNKLILTDDIDSLLSCTILKKIFGCKIAAFNNFNTLYFLNTGKKIKYSELIGIDLDSLGNSKTFGNHESYMYCNLNAINLNNVCRNTKNYNYHSKYNLSTTLLILSLYNVKIQNLNDEQLLALMSIDSAYIGYYNGYDKETLLKWLKILQFEFIEDRILKKYNVEDFESIKNKYNLNGKIEIDPENNTLKTGIKLQELSKLLDINIKLPSGTFKKVKEFNNRTIRLYKDEMPELKNIYSMARVNTKIIKISTFND